MVTRAEALDELCERIGEALFAYDDAQKLAYLRRQLHGCGTCGRKGSPFMVPAGWHHFSLRGERMSMWPHLCPECGNRAAAC